MALLADVEAPAPAAVSRPIAIVGAGTIVRVAHLPAYRKAGFNVRGIFDVDRERATALADEFGLPQVYGDLDELLADPAVQIVDVAIPAEFQPEVAARAAGSGRHLLCHKPLAVSLREAERLVADVRRAGVKLVVNQQTRYAPAIVTLRKLLEHGVLGRPTRLAFDFGFYEDSPWWNAMAEPALRGDCIHTLDVARALLGEPDHVRALAWREQGQRAIGTTIVEILLSYSEHLGARITSNSIWWPDDMRADVELQGTDGVVRASLSEWTHYPIPLPDRLELVLRDEPSVRYVPAYRTSHIPDAFIATMHQLMIAIEDDAEPELSGEENLRTLALLEAVSSAISSGNAERVGAP